MVSRGLTDSKRDGGGSVEWDSGSEGVTEQNWGSDGAIEGHKQLQCENSVYLIPPAAVPNDIILFNTS